MVVDDCGAAKNYLLWRTFGSADPRERARTDRITLVARPGNFLGVFVSFFSFSLDILRGALKYTIARDNDVGYYICPRGKNRSVTQLVRYNSKYRIKQPCL